MSAVPGNLFVFPSGRTLRKGELVAHRLEHRARGKIIRVLAEAPSKGNYSYFLRENNMRCILGSHRCELNLAVAGQTSLKPCSKQTTLANEKR